MYFGTPYKDCKVYKTFLQHDKGQPLGIVFVEIKSTKKPPIFQQVEETQLCLIMVKDVFPASQPAPDWGI